MTYDSDGAFKKVAKQSSLSAVQNQPVLGSGIPFLWARPYAMNRNGKPLTCLFWQRPWDSAVHDYGNTSI